MFGGEIISNDTSLTDAEYFQRIIEFSVDHLIKETVNADPANIIEWEHCLLALLGELPESPQVTPLYEMIDRPDVIGTYIRIIVGSGIAKYVEHVYGLIDSEFEPRHWGSELHSHAKYALRDGIVVNALRRGLHPERFNKFIRWRKCSGNGGEEACAIFEKFVLKGDGAALPEVAGASANEEGSGYSLEPGSTNLVSASSI